MRVKEQRGEWRSRAGTRGKGDAVIDCQLITDAETCMLATASARVIHFSLDDVPMLTNAGKGVRGIKVEGSDQVLGMIQLSRPSDCLRAKNTKNALASCIQNA